MKKILFINDTSLSLTDSIGLSLHSIIDEGNQIGHECILDTVTDFESTKKRISSSDLVILLNTSNCKDEQNLLNFILTQETDYIKVEFNYNFCVRNNIICRTDSNVFSCCNPEKYHLYQTVFANAVFSIFQNQKQYDDHYYFYGKSLINYHLFSFNNSDDSSKNTVFWTLISDNFSRKNYKNTIESIGNVLVYKSYGGLGDIFFTIPSLINLNKQAKSLTFAVHPRLVTFFSKHLNSITIVNEEIARTEEDKYDLVVELGNYPVFQSVKNAVEYSTNGKVNQHAIQHYIDAVAKLDFRISNKNNPFPYFERKVNYENPFYTIHPGAGFLLKAWPLENFAKIIETLYDLFPNLGCKIIVGPDDPNPQRFFSKELPHIELITGDLVDVGNNLSASLFHVGNDAGITHVAGAFNVPTVGLYGPTGPGSWGIYSEINQIIWGKHNTCFQNCNYELITNCADRVCLNSIKIENVISKIYSILQKAYPVTDTQIVLNPLIEFENFDSECLVKLENKDFLIEYKKESLKKSVLNIQKGIFSDEITEDEIPLYNFLFEEEMIYEIPNFNRINLFL